ncbi:hypothetical protein F4604DRAFT_1920524 [Suillus subluteus]|nr:hypothetical protein F4604DRAFT_1920524 [Suillus subluteus]
MNSTCLKQSRTASVTDGSFPQYFLLKFMVNTRNAQRSWILPTHPLHIDHNRNAVSTQPNFPPSQAEPHVSEAVKDGFSYTSLANLVSGFSILLVPSAPPADPEFANADGEISAYSSVLSPQVYGEHQECPAFMDSPSYPPSAEGLEQYPPSPYRAQQGVLGRLRTSVSTHPLSIFNYPWQSPNPV